MFSQERPVCLPQKLCFMMPIGPYCGLPSCFLLVTLNPYTYYKLSRFCWSLQILKTKTYSLSFRSFAYIHFYGIFFSDRFIVAFETVGLKKL